MQTVVELPEYIHRVSKLLNNNEQQKVINYLATHPHAGDIMQGTGGIRKFRWSAGNRGKSGGVRVIYYFYNDSAPLFLLTIFGKNEKANLSKSERNELAQLTKFLIKNYGDKSV